MHIFYEFRFKGVSSISVTSALLKEKLFGVCDFYQHVGTRVYTATYIAI